MMIAYGALGAFFLDGAGADPTIGDTELKLSGALSMAI